MLRSSFIKLSSKCHHRQQLQKIIDSSPLLLKMGERLEFNWDKQCFVTPLPRTFVSYRSAKKQKGQALAWTVPKQSTLSGLTEICFARESFDGLDTDEEIRFDRNSIKSLAILNKDDPSYSEITKRMNKKILNQFNKNPEKLIEELLIHELIHVYDQQVYKKNIFSGNFQDLALAECRAYTFQGSSKTMEMNFTEHVLNIYLGMIGSCISGKGNTNVNLLQRLFHHLKFGTTMSPREANFKIMYPMVRSLDNMLDYRHISDLIDDFGDEHLMKYDKRKIDLAELEEVLFTCNKYIN